jgi:hypothetical protein
VDWSGYTDADLMALYKQVLANLVGTGGVQLTSGSSGDSSFGGQIAVSPFTILNSIRAELFQRGLVPTKGITRTRAIFRDQIAPF